MHRLVCGDAMDILETVPDKSVDLIFFSPPYDGIRVYGGQYDFNKRLWTWGKILSNKLVDGGFIVVVIQDQTKNFKKSLTSFKLATIWADEESKFDLGLWECLIYQRPGRPGAWWNTRFRVDHEYIMVFFKGKRPRCFNKEHMKIPTKYPGAKWGGTQRLTDGSLINQRSDYKVKSTKCPGTILPYSASTTERNKIKLKHPATFPDKMAADFIEAFTKPGDVILDPMCGSGTTVIQAIKLNRSAIGIDINEDYINIAEERIKNEINSIHGTG